MSPGPFASVDSVLKYGDGAESLQRVSPGRLEHFVYAALAKRGYAKVAPLETSIRQGQGVSMPVDTGSSPRDKMIAIGAVIFMVVGFIAIYIIYVVTSGHPAPHGPA